MNDRINPDQIDAYASAVRAVLIEMEYDGHLTIPMRISPISGDGIEIQVRDDGFVAWVETLANTSDTEVTYEGWDGNGKSVQHLKVRGTINNHRVDVITVHPVSAGAVA